MKRLCGFLGIPALLVMIVLLLWLLPSSTQIADAQRTFTAQVDVLSDAADGYSTVSCSCFINVDTKGYALFAPETDYEIHRFDIISVKPGAAQVCSLRVWTSSTDSTNLFQDDLYGTDHCMPINLTSGANEFFSFPINCAKFSITNIATSDDLMVVVYYKEE